MNQTQPGNRELGGAITAQKKAMRARRTNATCWFVLPIISRSQAVQQGGGTGGAFGPMPAERAASTNAIFRTVEKVGEGTLMSLERIRHSISFSRRSFGSRRGFCFSCFSADWICRQSLQGFSPLKVSFAPWTRPFSLE